MRIYGELCSRMRGVRSDTLALSMGGLLACAALVYRFVLAPSWSRAIDVTLPGRLVNSDASGAAKVRVLESEGSVIPGGVTSNDGYRVSVRACLCLWLCLWLWLWLSLWL